MKKVLVALSLGCLVALLTASSAFATHARPKAATPLTFKLVPAFDQCSGSSPAGMTHGVPLAVPSCSPPVQSSSYLTANSPDRAAPFNTAADATGTIILKVTCLVPGTTTQVAGANANPPCNDAGDQIDVKITATSSGVRCVGAAGQLNCSGGAGSLYNGKVLGTSSIRISDHYNAITPNPPGADCSDTTSCPATAIDLPFDVGTQCSAGACNTVTSADLTVPAVTLEGKRSVVGLGQIQIEDAGLDGNLAGGPACPPTCAQNGDGDDVSSVQGLFIP